MERELTEEREREEDPGPFAPEKIHMLKELYIVMGRFALCLQRNLSC
jgi:hypothetical protein